MEIIDCFQKSKKKHNRPHLLLLNLISAVISTVVIYENNIWVGPKPKFWIRRDRILSIRRISDFWKTVGFRRIRMRIRIPSHP